MTSINKKNKFSLKSVKHVTVLYNRVKQLYFGEDKNILADEDTILTAKEINKTLNENGYKSELFELDENNVSKIPHLKTDFLFNLCGGIGSIPDTEAEAAKIIATSGIPYSGATSEIIISTTDKILTKEMFIKNKLPTPWYFKLHEKHDKLPVNIKFPVIIKPSGTDCSFGLDNNSVVMIKKKLIERARKIIEEYKSPALIERYIEGRELNVAVLGNGKAAKVLPISEILFGEAFKKKRWKIVDFDAKWEADSLSYQETKGVCPAILSPQIFKKIEKLCLLAYEKICDNPGYCRFDLRLTPKNQIYFLEINVNPDISSGAGAFRSAKAAGYQYHEFLEKIIEVSCRRFYHDL